jgi:DNA-binding transcriptional ArsR family regulator
MANPQGSKLTDKSDSRSFPAWDGNHALDDLAEVMKALGHPSRVEIIRQLAIRDRCCSGDICGCMPLAQSTISQHIDMLKSVGLVDWKPQGNRSMYTLNRRRLAQVAEQIAAIAAIETSLGNRHSVKVETP